MSILGTTRQPDKSDLLASYTNGVKPDTALFKQEIAVQKAWAKGLNEIGLISLNEFNDIERALSKTYVLMESNDFDWRIVDEDIHMNIERFVNEETNGLGKKMHIGRSRNDLIATTLKLHVADASILIQSEIKKLIKSLVILAENNLDILIPGMTHLQNGQPIRFSHALLGHAWALKRNADRFGQVKDEALEFMPLGSAALAGTTIPINLQHIARVLGFKEITPNSYDAVGDRDAIVNFLQAASLFGAHLSRLAEDIIYWCSAPVGIIKLSPNWSTGSSIMPNKRNPDVAELARGKAALWMGDTSGVLTLLKALSTSYGSDLHETKIPYLRVFEDIKLTLKVFTHFCEELTFNRQKANGLLNHGHILATEIADILTENGMAFREAYKTVALMVELAESKGIQVHELTLNDISFLNLPISKNIFKDLSFENSVEKRNYPGGTSIDRVTDQIQKIKLYLSTTQYPA